MSKINITYLEFILAPPKVEHDIIFGVFIKSKLIYILP